MTGIKSLGIRRQGILISFEAYYAEFRKYPQNPDDLLKVTTTELPLKSFKKYRKWFFEFTGKSDNAMV